MAAKGEVVEADKTTSTFYCPKLAEHLVRNLMPLTPLWTQIISSQVASNAAVESYMRIVKKQILRGRTRLHPCEFIRRLNNDEIARVKMDSIPTRPAPRGRKRKQKSPLHNPDQHEEQWAKRNPTADRPSWYARPRPPSCILRPESSKLPTGKKHEEPKPRQPKQDAQQLSEEAESWCNIQLVDESVKSLASGLRPESSKLRTGKRHEEPKTSQPKQDAQQLSEEAESWCNIQLDDESVKSVAPGQWMTDDALNSYCQALAISSGGRVATFATYWQPAMKAGRTSAMLKAMLTAQGVHAADIWLLPYNRRGNHWAIYIVAVKAKTIVHMDSWRQNGLGRPNRLDVVFIQRLLEAAGMANQTTWRTWRLVDPKETPQQPDTFSCGPRVCFYAEVAATGCHRRFCDSSMRVRILQEIRSMPVIETYCHV